MKLYEIAESYQLAWEDLEAEGFDPQTIEDTLSAIQDDGKTKLINCAKITRNMKSEITIVEMEIARLQKLLKVKRKRLDWLEDYIVRGIEKLGLKQVEDGVHKLALRQSNPAVEILCPQTDIPGEFIKVSIEKKPDKIAIRDYLKENPDTNWAKLTRKTTVVY